MLRTLAFTGLIAASLAGAAMAAEPGQTLVNRSNDAATAVRHDNLVGGAAYNADGSVSYIYQDGHRSVNDGYTQPQVGAYEGY